MSRALTVRRKEVLRDQFPSWRIREVTGQWIAAREGAPVVVRASAFELREAMRWIDGATRDQAGPDTAGHLGTERRPDEDAPVPAPFAVRNRRP